MAKKKKSFQGDKLFIITIALLAYLVGWSFWRNIRPSIIMASCSEAAFKSSQVYLVNAKTEFSLGYDYLLATCLEENGLR
jgi:hypothetical protein